MQMEAEAGQEKDWLVDDIWPMGRHIHLHAARKVGKSLVSMWIAGNLALGREPFTGDPIEPLVVGLHDFEMTGADVLERLKDMGFDLKAIQPNLHYYQIHQPFPTLDTEKGGNLLLKNSVANHEQVIIIDTLSRVVEGNENDASTYSDFFRFTGAPLKAEGISLLRLDHEGHLEGRSRGSSAKGDDVDIVWQLKAVEGGYQFNRKASRVSWVPEQVTVQMQENPHLAFRRGMTAWPEGTKEKAHELDLCKAPLGISRRKARDLLIEKGYVAGRNEVIAAAIKFRSLKVL